MARHIRCCLYHWLNPIFLDSVLCATILTKTILLEIYIIWVSSPKRHKSWVRGIVASCLGLWEQKLFVTLMGSWCFEVISIYDFVLFKLPTCFLYIFSTVWHEYSTISTPSSLCHNNFTLDDSPFTADSFVKLGTHVINAVLCQFFQLELNGSSSFESISRGYPCPPN